MSSSPQDHQEENSSPFSRSLIKKSNHNFSGSDKKQKTHRLNFWLTQTQKNIIQSRLPHLFSLIQIKFPSSRLLADSKALQDDTIKFVERKRGRPEGSISKNKRKIDLNERKSERIMKKKKRKTKQWQKDSSEYEKQQIISYQQDSIQEDKYQDYSDSVSQKDIKSQKGHDLSRDNNDILEKGEIVIDQYKKILHQYKMKIEQLNIPQHDFIFLKNKKTKSGREKQQIFKVEQESSPILVKRLIKEEKSYEQGEQIHNEYPNNLIQQKKTYFKTDLNSMQKQNIDIDKLNLKDNNEFGKINKSPKNINPHLGQLNQISFDFMETKHIEDKFGPQLKILRQLKRRKDVIPFLEPVDQEKDGAPEYYQTIDDPIDMQTIQFKVRNNIYKDSTFFHLDMEKMWKNARKYNIDNPFMLRITNSVEKKYLNLLKQYRPNLLLKEVLKTK